MSKLSHSINALLLVRDEQGRYLPASNEQILEVARQVIDRKIPCGTPFTSPMLVKDYLRTKLTGLEHEVFSALFLNSQHCLIKYTELFRGTIDATAVYPREVVKIALALNASAVIFSHNHPSGNPEPSHADMAITTRLKDALALVEVRTLDHIIVGGEATMSFAERGLL